MYSCNFFFKDPFSPCLARSGAVIESLRAIPGSDQACGSGSGKMKKNGSGSGFLKVWIRVRFQSEHQDPKSLLNRTFYQYILAKFMIKQ